VSDIVLDIVEQHAEEAAFLWLLREAALRAPHYSLADLAALEERIEAHFDGLRIAGEAGREACMAALKTQEAEEIFVAAVLALESGQPKAVLDWATERPAITKGLVSAMGWVEPERAAPMIAQLTKSPVPELRLVGIAAAAVHRIDPGPPLRDALQDPYVPLRCRALRAVGELGRTDLLPTLKTSLEDSDEDTRFWAAWSSALCANDRAAVRILQASAEAGSPRALAILVSRLSDARAWIRTLSGNPQRRRLAIVAAGLLGDPGTIPWLIEEMNHPTTARAAGEAFSAITGADLEQDRLEGAMPEGFEGGPTDDPREENVAVDEDEDLFWPKVDAVRRWWTERSSRFKQGVRYVLGLPHTKEALVKALRTSNQRRRSAAALELRLRGESQVLFEVRAPAARQARELSLANFKS